MNGQCEQGDNSTNHGVPVQNAWLFVYPPVGPERQKEIAIFGQRDTADHIGEGRSKEDRQQRTGEKKQAIKKGPPDSAVDLHAQLDTGAPHDQEPEYDHERQVETAKSRGIEQGKCKIKRASAG